MGGNGNTGVWTQITVDEELGLVYLPVEDPDRPTSTAAIGPATTCSPTAWSRRPQDRPAQVALPDRAPSDLGLRLVVARRFSPTSPSTAAPIKAVALPTQAGLSLCLRSRSPDSRSGRSKSGRCRRPTCRARRPRRRSRFRPSRPPTSRNVRHRSDDLIDFTPELQAQALEQMKRYKIGPMFKPPVVSKVNGPIAAHDHGTGSGGTNWPGGSLRSRDPHRVRACVQLGI